MSSDVPFLSSLNFPGHQDSCGSLDEEIFGELRKSSSDPSLMSPSGKVYVVTRELPIATREAPMETIEKCLRTFLLFPDFFSLQILVQKDLRLFYAEQGFLFDLRSLKKEFFAQSEDACVESVSSEEKPLFSPLSPVLDETQRGRLTEYCLNLVNAVFVSYLDYLNNHRDCFHSVKEFEIEKTSPFPLSVSIKMDFQTLGLGESKQSDLDSVIKIQAFDIASLEGFKVWFFNGDRKKSQILERLPPALYSVELSEPFHFKIEPPLLKIKRRFKELEDRIEFLGIQILFKKEGGYNFYSEKGSVFDLRCFDQEVRREEVDSVLDSSVEAKVDLFSASQERIEFNQSCLDLVENVFSAHIECLFKSSLNFYLIHHLSHEKVSFFPISICISLDFQKESERPLQIKYSNIQSFEELRQWCLYKNELRK